MLKPPWMYVIYDEWSVSQSMGGALLAFGAVVVSFIISNVAIYTLYHGGRTILLIFIVGLVDPLDDITSVSVHDETGTPEAHGEMGVFCFIGKGVHIPSFLQFVLLQSFYGGFNEWLCLS